MWRFTEESDRFRQVGNKTMQNNNRTSLFLEMFGAVQCLGKKKTSHLLFMFSCRGVRSFVKPLIVPLTLSLWNILSLSLWLNITARPRGKGENKGWKEEWRDRAHELPLLRSSLNKHGLSPRTSAEQGNVSKWKRHREREKKRGDWGWTWWRRELETRDGKEMEYLCAEQKGVQSIILRQADRTVWGVYFYLDIRGVWIGYSSLVASFSGGFYRTASVLVWHLSCLPLFTQTHVRSNTHGVSKLQVKACAVILTAIVFGHP